MSTNMYSRKGQSAGGLNDLISEIAPAIKITSIVDGQTDYSAEIRKLNAKEIEELCIPSNYNGRRFEHLTRVAVADIYDDIVDSGGNTEIAKGVLLNGKIHVLTGLRRMFCVLHSMNTVFNIAIVEGMLEEDQKHIARIADIYDEPSVMDFAYSVRAIRKTTKEANGKPMPLAEIAKLKGCSKGKVVEAEHFAGLPDFIIKPFPGLRFIGYAWLRSVSKYNGYFAKAKTTLEKLPSGSEQALDSLEDAQKYSKQVAKDILATLKSYVPNEVSETQQKWLSVKVKAGINIKSTDNKLGINLDLDKVEPKLLKAIEKLITE